VAASKRDDEDEIYISLDGQNICLSKPLEIVGLLIIIRQLKQISEKSGMKIRVETISPPWAFKEYAPNIRRFSRLISLWVWKEDKEIDDYLVASLASAFNGYYISNDKKMHKQIGKDDDWRDEHRIGWKNPKEIKKIRQQITEERDFSRITIELNIPEGKLSDVYNDMKKQGELVVDFEDWEKEFLKDKIEVTTKKTKKTLQKPPPAKTKIYPLIKNLNASKGGVNLPREPRQTAEVLLWLATYNTEFDDYRSLKKALRESGILPLSRVGRILDLVRTSISPPSLVDEESEQMVPQAEIHEIEIPVEGLASLSDDILRQCKEGGETLAAASLAEGTLEAIPEDLINQYFRDVKTELELMIS